MSGGFTKGKQFRVNNLVYEHVMVMWLYAGLMRERAFEMIDKGKRFLFWALRCFPLLFLRTLLTRFQG